jgi:hypothetical protein
MSKLISTTELQKIGATLSFCHQMKARISPVKDVGYRLFIFLHGEQHVVFKDIPDQVYFPTMEAVLDVIGGVRNLVHQVLLDVNNWPSPSVALAEKRHGFDSAPRWTEQPRPCFLTLEESAVF